MAAEVMRLRTGVPAAPAAGKSIRIDVSPGELVDRIAVLQLKSERLTDDARLATVRAELAALQAEHAKALKASKKLKALTAELRAVHESLWQIEDELRLCERNEDFAAHFIDLARSLFPQQDLRVALKRQINELVGAAPMEERADAAYP